MKCNSIGDMEKMQLKYMLEVDPKEVSGRLYVKKKKQGNYVKGDSRINKQMVRVEALGKSWLGDRVEGKLSWGHKNVRFLYPIHMEMFTKH